MSLLEEIKKLRALEQQTIKDRVEHWPIYQYRAAKLAPAMIEVLECFKEGDAALLDRFVHIETEGAKLMAGFGKINEHHQKIIDALSRLQKAASLMEGQ